MGSEANRIRALENTAYILDISKWSNRRLPDKQRLHSIQRKFSHTYEFALTETNRHRMREARGRGVRTLQADASVRTLPQPLSHGALLITPLPQLIKIITTNSACTAPLVNTPSAFRSPPPKTMMVQTFDVVSADFSGICCARLPHCSLYEQLPLPSVAAWSRSLYLANSPQTTPVWFASPESPY
jgi:hypothetical protein